MAESIIFSCSRPAKPLSFPFLYTINISLNISVFQVDARREIGPKAVITNIYVVEFLNDKLHSTLIAVYWKTWVKHHWLVSGCSLHLLQFALFPAAVGVPLYRANSLVVGSSSYTEVWLGRGCCFSSSTMLKAVLTEFFKGVIPSILSWLVDTHSSAFTVSYRTTVCLTVNA